MFRQNPANSEIISLLLCLFSLSLFLPPSFLIHFCTSLLLIVTRVRKTKDAHKNSHIYVTELYLERYHSRTKRSDITQQY